MSIEELEREIVYRIVKVEQVLKIILFGSRAHGRPTETSDIDLIVVINKDENPGSFKEKSENYLRISRAIRPIEKKIPVDLLVYTKPEFERFIELDSMFSRKIISEGKELF